MVGEENRREKLNVLADAIKELKQQHYCGSQNAYEYLKGRMEYVELRVKIDRELKKEFPWARMPALNEVFLLNAKLGDLISDHISMKKYGVLFDELDFLANNNKRKMIASEVNAWFDRDFYNFCRSYFCRTECYMEDKRTVYVDQCIKLFGESNKQLLDKLEVSAESLIERVNDPHYEAFISAVNADNHFGPFATYIRLKRDHLDKRDDYQRKLIGNYLSSLGMELAGESFPKTFEELISKRNVRSRFLKLLKQTIEEKNPELFSEVKELMRPLNRERDVEEYKKEYDGYLNIILHRHSSFVEKMLKEYNSEK